MQVVRTTVIAVVVVVVVVFTVVYCRTTAVVPGKWEKAHPLSRYV